MVDAKTDKIRRQIDKLEKIALKGCSDPGYGGCIPLCDACKARNKLRELRGLNA